MLIPYGSAYVVLSLIQAVCVLCPRDATPIGSLRRHAIAGLIPLVGIGGVVLAVSTRPGLAQRLVDVSAIATPLLALGSVTALRVRLLAAAAPLLYLAAWRGTGRVGDLAGDAIIVFACVCLAWLTGAVAPRWALCVGIVVATIVDVYQVLATHQVQRVVSALEHARAPAGLPPLRELTYQGATMGWGDVYLAALLGVVLARLPRRSRLVAMIVVAVAGLAEGFGFRIWSTLPATVPVAVALGVSLLGRTDREATLQA